jgi:hypothetical protein
MPASARAEGRTRLNLSMNEMVFCIFIGVDADTAAEQIQDAKVRFER